MLSAEEKKKSYKNKGKSPNLSAKVMIAEGICVVVWFQNIDGIVMARQYDTGKVNDYYRPIPVHSSHAANSRGHRGSGTPYPSNKPYMGQDATPPPRYEADYDYKTTHYPTYPPNYPYDEAKYKYEAAGGGGGMPQPGGYTGYEAKSYPSHGGYEAVPSVQVPYDNRGYAAVPSTPAPPPPPGTVPIQYPHDQQLQPQQQQQHPADYARYGYDERSAGGVPAAAVYPQAVDNHHHHYPHQEKYAAAGYGDGRQTGYDQHEARYDSRYDSRTDGRDGVDSRYDERRYDGREEHDSRYDSSSRYPSSKDGYYDRYYKSRTPREQEAARY